MGMMMPETMPLAALLERIDNISNDLTIYITDTSQLSSTSATVAQQEPTDGAAPPSMRYLLEVPLAREAIKVWSDWREGRVPSSDDKVEAVIYYAEHDAYLPVE
jgi:hypothetical protein